MPQHREIENKTYNERLFSPGIRGFFHNARFTWLHSAMKKVGMRSGSVLELGFNDGRSIRYIPFEPLKYAGYDADWEGGFDEAVNNFKDYHQYAFIRSADPATFNAGGEIFDAVLAMETIEHLPVQFLPEYLEKMAAATGRYGFFSVPNEKGLLFFLKYLLKRIFRTAGPPYSTREVWHALTGNLAGVERKDTTHKGFDYDVLIRQLSVYFDLVEVQGLPFGWLPLSLSFTIGIIVKKK